MHRPYRVVTVDLAGCTYEYDFFFFSSAARHAARVRAQHPKCHVHILNTNRMDAGFDGLTDAEREEA